MTEVVGEGVRLLAGRYQIGELIGRGGMADVRVGTDARLGRRVAIKLLKPALAMDPAFRTRFRREAQDAAKMAHPTIVRIFDAGEETVTDPKGNEAQIPFIVMEYVDGRLLKDVLAEDGPLDPAEATRIIAQVLTALEYSHRAGVIHRDIKPGNIMIASNGQVKVMDFGIARAISDSSATIAETSKIVGTAQYFSPEQARGESVDARTDLYSTAVVLFELLTGQAPFRGENPVAVAYQHVNQNPAAPSTINPKVSPALDAVVLRGLSKDRTTRFQNATEFRDEVEAAAAGIAPPRKTVPVTDFTATLFGVNPQATASSEAALRQLTVDAESRGTRTQTRPPVAWIWAGIVLVAVVLVAVVFWTINLPKGTDIAQGLSVAVPDVAGESYASAAKELTGLKLIPQRQDQASDTVDVGTVIGTVPGAGTKVGATQIIEVIVSLGPTTIPVPDLAGFNTTKAKSTLTALGLTLGSTTKANSPTVKAGIIIKSNPAVGSNAVKGDAIDIIVSTGKVTVPSVVGDAAGVAGSTLAALHLNVQVVTTTTCSGGKVTDQSLSPGTHTQGSDITLTVCAG
ncbi:Stk1 family PASTA domain-containing Ser/Thr kinase [Galbitalea soli]|uniref:non-specific serine/threonine protein kinase n=1 Tax=Galbitalea soli TaxID=1268042 RepID=A0A7C9TST2_9MICO|nr:Stk1 family PASTA domain-containing Ser/Thr kinase [Galbitalea soli]NYJ29424.1 serine/threonine-protein kinase [Galbitalea soli]